MKPPKRDEARRAGMGHFAPDAPPLPPPDGSRTLGWEREATQREFQARYAPTGPGTSRMHTPWLDYGRLPIRPNGQLGIDVGVALPTRVDQYFGVATNAGTRPDKFWAWDPAGQRKTYSLIGE